MNAQLTSLAEGYVRAVNRGDAAAFLALFDANAHVNDANRDFHGQGAIKAWSDREIFAAQVTLEVRDETHHDGEAVITTKVDGNFDRTGLPDPVVITHRLTIEGDKIIRLTCRLAE